MSWTEIIIILVVGMFVLGPERIPVAVKWLGSTLRTVRTMAAGAQEQLRGEFGPELEELRRQIADLQSLKEIQELRSLRDLNPRSMISKNLLGDEFSGGLSGFLGLNSPPDGPPPTGSGMAPEPVQQESNWTQIPVDQPPAADAEPPAADAEPPPTVDQPVAFLEPLEAFEQVGALHPPASRPVDFSALEPHHGGAEQGQASTASPTEIDPELDRYHMGAEFYGRHDADRRQDPEPARSSTTFDPDAT